MVGPESRVCYLESELTKSRGNVTSQDISMLFANISNLHIQMTTILSMTLKRYREKSKANSVWVCHLHRISRVSSKTFWHFWILREKKILIYVFPHMTFFLSYYIYVEQVFIPRKKRSLWTNSSSWSYMTLLGSIQAHRLLSFRYLLSRSF